MQSSSETTEDVWDWDHAEEQTENFSEIREFFDEEWEELSHIEKERYKRIMERHKFMTEKLGIKCPLPHFMQKKSAPKLKKSSHVGQKSKLENNKMVLSSRNSDLAEKHKGSEKDVSEKYEETEDVEKEVQQAVPGTSSSEPHQIQKLKRHIPVMGQTISYPAKLPVFGPAALAELQKPSHIRNAGIVNTECRAYLVQALGTDFPSKKDYNNFCRTMVEKFPHLQSPLERVPWAAFKYSLRKSFSAKRNYKNNIAPQREATKYSKSYLETADHDDIDTIDESNNTEADLDEKLRTCTHRSAIKDLLKKTVSYRRQIRGTLTLEEILERYPHLKKTDMMIFDYIESEGHNMETLTHKFSESCVLLAQHYKIEPNSEYNKICLVMNVHKHFLSLAVRKGSKPVFTVVDECEARTHLQSSGIQAPFIVILTKRNYLTGEVNLTSATVTARDHLINCCPDPTSEMCILLLLASYFTLNIEYPKAYMQFMRALERLVTGKVAYSKYGRTSLAFDKFLSMLKSK